MLDLSYFYFADVAIVTTSAVEPWPAIHMEMSQILNVLKTS